VVGVFILVQQLEGNLIVPLIADRTVYVPSALALFGVISMGILFGPLGLLFGFSRTHATARRIV
jgi:predicted PurR-regulated permease PerM